MLWWLSHMTRIVMKLVTMAKKNGASLIRPSDNDVVSVDGSWRFRTSNVMAKAKTPSLKASVLAVSFAPRLSPFSMGRVRRHASGRFEGAAGRSDGVWVLRTVSPLMAPWALRCSVPPARQGLLPVPSHEIRPSHTGLQALEVQAWQAH